MENRLAAIILAAGSGTRMRSARAKVLHELAGEPMIARTLRPSRLGPRPLIVVVGYQAEEVEAAARRACLNASTSVLRSRASSAAPETPRAARWLRCPQISTATY